MTLGTPIGKVRIAGVTSDVPAGAAKRNYSVEFSLLVKFGNKLFHAFGQSFSGKCAVFALNNGFDVLTDGGGDFVVVHVDGKSRFKNARVNHERLHAEFFEQPFDVGKFLAFGVEGSSYCYPLQFVSLHSKNFL